MNLEDFRNKLASKALATFPGFLVTDFEAFVGWIEDNLPNEPSTWEKIMEQHAELCRLTDRGYLIKTKDDGTHALVWLGPRDGWVNDISYTTDDNFLKQITAMMKEELRVTFAEAKAAHESLGECWTVKCEASWQRLDRYFDQEEEARP